MNLKLLVFILAIVLGLRFSFFYQNKTQYRDGQNVEITTTLNSEPRLTGNRQTFVANLDSGNKIFITTSAFPSFSYGQVIRIVGNLQIRLLSNKNSVLNLYFPKIEVVKTLQPFFIKAFLAVTSFVRQHIIDFYLKNLPSNYSSLMLGIVFGIKESLPANLSNSLRNAGVYHVIAASGMNIAMVSVFLTSFFTLLLGRKIGLIATILGIIFYASLAGFEASIVRASIMGIVAFSAQILGRQSLAIFSLILAGFIMLFVSPSLISDIGFQLSFLATLGLLYLNPFFGNLIKGKFVIGRVLEGDILTTISAQIATLPILLANFGSYPIFSTVSNFLVLWTIPVLMIIGGFSAILSFVFEPLARILLFLSIPFIFYFEKTTELTSNIGPMIKINIFPWQFTVGYYLILASILLTFKKKIK